jgi:hypothetical protein
MLRQQQHLMVVGNVESESLPRRMPPKSGEFAVFNVSHKVGSHPARTPRDESRGGVRERGCLVHQRTPLLSERSTGWHSGRCRHLSSSITVRKLSFHVDRGRFALMSFHTGRPSESLARPRTTAPTEPGKLRYRRPA